MNESPAEYGVIGNPVSHSRSPFIHALFAKQTGQQLIYRLHEVAAENLPSHVMEFWRRGGKGLNVTVPHKVAACGLVRTLSERATRAGAVNTLLMDEDGITGDNTDGAGLVRDLTANLKLNLNDARILMLGSGGAVRGVVGPLLDQSPKLIMIAGRSADRAESLARIFGALGPVQGCGLEQLGRVGFDVIINATSAGLTGEMPQVPKGVLHEATFCYDMSYARGGTAFLRWAGQHGCSRAAQGWGMLVEQAAESFELWRGVRPATEAVLAALTSGS